MGNEIDQKLYETVKEEAKKRFKRWPSAYGSAWLTKEYLRRGGRYASKSRKGGVKRWMKESWVQVSAGLKGKMVACGHGKHSKACRPSKRVSKHTHMTLDEVVARHGRDKVAQLARHKRRNMSDRIDWKKGVVTRKKKSVSRA